MEQTERGAAEPQGRCGADRPGSRSLKVNAWAAPTRCALDCAAALMAINAAGRRDTPLDDLKG